MDNEDPLGLNMPRMAIPEPSPEVLPHTPEGEIDFYKLSFIMNVRLSDDRYALQRTELTEYVLRSVYMAAQENTVQ